ncbi:SH3 and multiple ankyrin repeat domains protein 3 [Liparis tanakae]|uniref:SH3 and multiple ankyrin repeat domains protein 3 n=1 Tax=Liparis tanakae TaxID=230148 RepID=A0A4Z2E7K9_9TELE|nr:SH3 and multiple ankyrin repeat domains protein 3 [Liparis tanakae]
MRSGFSTSVSECQKLSDTEQEGVEKCMKFNVDAPIWRSKQRILCTLNQSLKDVLNYGLFQPAYNGKAGKFLDEERELKEYPFPSIAPVPYLEVGMDPVHV